MSDTKKKIEDTDLTVDRLENLAKLVVDSWDMDCLLEFAQEQVFQDYLVISFFSLPQKLLAIRHTLSFKPCLLQQQQLLFLVQLLKELKLVLLCFYLSFMFQSYIQLLVLGNGEEVFLAHLFLKT